MVVGEIEKLSRMKSMKGLGCPIAIIDKSGDIRSFGTRLVDAVCSNNEADELKALVMIADMIVRKTDTGVKVNG